MKVKPDKNSHQPTAQELAVEMVLTADSPTESEIISIHNFFDWLFCEAMKIEQEKEDLPKAA